MDNHLHRVEIQHVAPTTVDPLVLWGAGLNSPTLGTSGSYSIGIAGWVLPRAGQRAKVQFTCGRRILSELEIDRWRPDVLKHFPDIPGAEHCGFYGSLRTVELPSQFDIQISIKLEGHGLLPMTTIRGCRNSIVPAPVESLRPIFITSLGRCGSTYLALLLKNHPEIVVAGPFPYENHVLPYWVSVFETLSAPQSFLKQLASPLRGHYWWLGDARDSVETYLERFPNVDLVGGDAVDAAATFCRARVYAYDAQLAARVGKPKAVYFAEKLPPSGPNPLAEQLFPTTREIVLLRDPRDIIASVLAFNRKRGFASFSRELVQSDLEYVASIRHQWLALAVGWRNRKTNAIVVRYEDLMEKRDETVRSVFGALNLSASDDVLRHVVEASAQEDVALQEAHMTSTSTESSIGRWKRELPSELQKACRDTLGDALEEFGYAV